nr:ribonuclease 3-like protein 3 [Tanacetum cinerariifolium]
MEFQKNCFVFHQTNASRSRWAKIRFKTEESIGAAQAIAEKKKWMVVIIPLKGGEALIQPFVTPENFKLHPVAKFNEACQKNGLKPKPIDILCQHAAREDSPVEVAVPPTKSKPTTGRQKRKTQNKDAPRSTAWKNEKEIALCKGWVIRKILKWMDTEVLNFLANHQASKRYKTSGSSSFNTESEDASINLNKKGSRSSGSSSSMNDEALARLMVSEMAMHNERAIEMKKEECLAFLEIKRREVECRERELAMQEYQQHQKDIMFYMQPCDHLTGIHAYRWKK